MRQTALGSGLLLAPLAWFASLEANFALAPLVCTGYGKSAVLVVSVGALALVAAGGVSGWTQRHFHRRLAIAGAAISVFCALVIVAQAIPNLMLGGCE